MDWTYSRVPSDLDLKKKKIHQEKTKRKLNASNQFLLVDMIPKPEFLQTQFRGGIPTIPTVWNVSYKKKNSYFPLNPGWFIGILILAYEKIPI